MKYFSNTSWMFLEKILRMLVGVGVGLWLARYLGPEEFGFLSYVISFVAIFSSVASLGLDNIVVRELVNKEEQRDKILGTAFVLKLAGSGLVFLLLVLATLLQFHEGETTLYVFVVALAVVFKSFDVVMYYFQSRALSRFFVFSNTLALIASSILKVILIINEMPLLYFCAAIVFDAFVLSCGLIFFFCRLNLSVLDWGFDVGLAKRMMLDSWPLIIGAIAAALYIQIDQVMVRNILGNELAGYYAVAARLSDIWLFITVAVTGSLLPSVINSRKLSYENFISKMQSIYSGLVVVAVGICIFFSAFSGGIVSALYGEAYYAAGPILSIYIWSIIFVYLSNASTNYFVVENMQVHASCRLVVGAAINIILNLYWIEVYGVEGAAYATLVSYSFSSYFYNALFKETRRNFYMQSKALLCIVNYKSYLWLGRVCR